MRPLGRNKVLRVVIEDPEMEEIKPPVSARSARITQQKEEVTQKEKPDNVKNTKSSKKQEDVPAHHTRSSDTKQETKEDRPPMSARAARLAAIASGSYIIEKETPRPKRARNNIVHTYEENTDESMDDSMDDSMEEENTNEDDTDEERSLEEGLDEKEAQEDEVDLVLEKSFSQFKSTNKNTCIFEQDGETYLFLGLKAGEDIVFMGQVYAAPLFGAVTIAGATLSSERVVPQQAPENDLSVYFYPVFCPRSHALLSIRSTPLDTPYVAPHSSPLDIDESLLEAVYEEMDITDLQTILVLKELKGGMEGVCRVTGRYQNIISFKPEKEIQTAAPKIHLLPGFQPVLEQTPSVRAFHAPKDWHEQTTLEQPKVVSLVCGAKNQGKSSFSKYLINRLLNQYKTVAYLETDLGQTEFTPSGLVSLHYLQQPVFGPSFTHQQLEPVRSFFVGATTPRSNPDYYSACVQELFRHYQHDQTGNSEWIPLVINTQGWISGAGYEILLEHIQLTSPTDLFVMRHPTLKFKNMPANFEQDVLGVSERVVMHSVLSYSNAESLAAAFDAASIRDLTTASYFHQTEMGSEGCLMPRWDYTKHLVERVPWVVDWRANLNAIWVTYEEVKKEELFYALNGSVVGVLGDVVDYKIQKGPHRTVESEGFTPPTYLNTSDGSPQPEKTTCHGLAIVRAIDPSKHALLLLTPLPVETLENASAIVKGEIQLPTWALLDHVGDSNGVAKIGWENVPYVDSNGGEGVG
ncbi:Polynucleotide 5'-hydroxyl-kinase grc3, partial [Rhizopus stolonifer]